MTDLTRGTQGSRRGLDLATVDPRKAIRHARLHSLLVRLVRVGIIVSSVLAIGSLGFIALFDPFKRLPRQYFGRPCRHAGIAGHDGCPKNVGHAS